MLFLCLICLSSSLTQVNSQSPNIYDYGAKYKVKVGDSNQYRYSIINIAGKHYIPTTVDSNGKIIQVNITTSAIMTVTVTAINQTDGQDQVFIRVDTSIGQKKYDGVETYLYNFIIPAFDNKTIVEKFIYDITSNLPSSSQNPSYSVNGDFIEVESTNNFSSQISINRIALNWKTGWLEFNEQETIATNGTTLVHVKLQRITNNLVNNVINYAIDGATVLSVVTIVAVPILVFYSYKKFTSSSVQNKNVSFTQYVKTKGKKSKPKKVTRPNQADKALNMIDEILHENQ